MTGTRLASFGGLIFLMLFIFIVLALGWFLRSLLFDVLLLWFSFGRFYIFLILLLDDRWFRRRGLTGIGNISHKTSGESSYCQGSDSHKLFFHRDNPLSKYIKPSLGLFSMGLF